MSSWLGWCLKTKTIITSPMDSSYCGSNKIKFVRKNIFLSLRLNFLPTPVYITTVMMIFHKVVYLWLSLFQYIIFFEQIWALLCLVQIRPLKLCDRSNMQTLRQVGRLFNFWKQNNTKFYVILSAFSIHF